LKVSIRHVVLKSCPTRKQVTDRVVRSEARVVAVVVMIISVLPHMNLIIRAAAAVVDAEASKARKPERKSNVYMYERNY
jgi:hypothetical protein